MAVPDPSLSPHSVLICANCGTQNDPDRKFCIECGNALATACPACGTVNPPTAKFCGKCGTALAEAAARTEASAIAATAPMQPVAERRLVSVVFVDLVGFTLLSEGRDAEDMRELMTSYFEVAREIVGRHGGEIEKFIGDAVMAVWGTPTAHEDDAERAVRAALQLVDAVAAIEVAGQHLEARAGVLTGEAAVTIGAAGQGMVTGDMVNTASRLQSAAAPGTVLVGEATYRAASGAIAFETVGEQALKGKPTPVPAWQALAVVARRGGSGRSSTLEPPFVGRSEERRTLEDQFHATTREGKPRLVTVVGQAGIGKSRLAWELEKYLDGVVATILWLEGRSPAYGEGISYWALAEMVRGRAGIAETDDPQAALQKLASLLETTVPDAAERRWVESRLMGLLGLAELSTESREELFAAWRAFFERLADQAPVLLVFWDLQWADQGLLDFIEHLLTWARSSPIFVLAEARPELFELRPGWGATVRSAVSIHLEPLADDEMRALLLGLAPALPEQALRAIVGRAAGIPLYGVETLRMLIDRGVLAAEADGAHYALVADLPELAVPETLHALIAARLDALAAEDRSLVTDAAVLGLSFTVQSLLALRDLDAVAVDASLDRLVKHELLVRDTDPRSPERGQYRFVQAVVREVAYQSLAKRDRRTKHLAAARYFESLGEEELPGVLASHYLAAYRATSAGPEAEALAAQARVALGAAADRAASLHSQEGALAYLNQALEVTSDPLQQATMHERAANAARLSALVGEAREHARAAEAIYSSLDDRMGVLRSRTVDASTLIVDNADKAASEILMRALTEVSDLPPNTDIAHAQAELARALMMTGSPEALAWADRVLTAPGLLNATQLVEAAITKGTALITAGHLTEAEVILRGAIDVADRYGYAFSSMRARNNLTGIVEGVSIEEAVVVEREIYEIAQRYGQRIWVLQAITGGLSSSFDYGTWDDWLAEMREEEEQAGGYFQESFQGELARRMAYRGQPSQAGEIVERSLASDLVLRSAQATSQFAAMLGDIRWLEGRWAEAFAAARRGWNDSPQARNPITAALFAAFGAGEASLLADAIEAAASSLHGDQPIVAAVRLIGTTFQALLEGRWEEGRQAFMRAAGALEEVRHRRWLAHLQLAVGHFAEGRFPEAAAALSEAESFFGERGAAWLVPAYRDVAARPPFATHPRQPVVKAESVRPTAS
jgi:class 3 adenylate cyclase/tetratricopeptide (TPR) repeat protein